MDGKEQPAQLAPSNDGPNNPSLRDHFPLRYFNPSTLTHCIILYYSLLYGIISFSIFVLDSRYTRGLNAA